MKTRKNHIISLLSLFLLSVVIQSCSPVNLLTRANRTPRLYTENYNYPNVKSVRSEINRRAWVVYSDRAGNKTTARPGRTLVHTELEFMEPLIVIGKRGDYYKLIRYNPDVLNNWRFAGKKDAEYCGWIHKERLLLFNNTITEVRNGIKLKNLTAVQESRIILEADKFFKNDSVILYTQPRLEDFAETLIGLNQIVYVLKMTDNDTKALICYHPRINPEIAPSLTVGWVDAALVVPFGQRLTLNTAPEIANIFRSNTVFDSLRLAVSPVRSFSPVLFADHVDNTLIFRTLDAGSVIDRSNNRIFNVNGEPITYPESKVIETNLMDINVIFTFDLTENVVAQLPMLSNTLQNVKQVFETSLQGFNYRFAAVLDDHIISFENDYLNFSDKIIEATQTLNESRVFNNYRSLTHAVGLAGQMPKATNLIVHIGERAGNAESPPRNIIEGFINNNCRLLSYQVFSGNEDVYNNFVLQSAAIIEAYADTALILKRKIIVHPDQLQRANRFTESSVNNYALDFPNRSITQGMVIFPEKMRTAEPELLIMGIDSIVRQIESDNLILIAAMGRAFNQAGNYRDRYDDSFIEKFDIEPGSRIAPALIRAFDQILPDWLYITERVTKPVDSTNLANMGLLLTESELADLTGFFENLSSKQLDMKGETANNNNKTRGVRKVRRELRGVPSDTQLEQLYSIEYDTLSDRGYVRTNPVRKHLKKTYLQALRSSIVDGNKRKLTLAQALEYITTAPSVTSELNRIRVKDLRRKSVVPDAQLDALIQYFGKHKALLEEKAKPVGELNNPDGEKYFLIPGMALP